jgi:Fe2+ transport system protein B
MVFILYYIPCFPTIKVMFDEIHWKKTLINITISLSSAYLLATSVYWLGYCFCK